MTMSDLLEECLQESRTHIYIVIVHSHENLRKCFHSVSFLR